MPEEEKEEYIEIDASKITEENKVFLRVETLTSYKDVDKIIEHLRNNKVIFLRIGELKKNNANEVKRSIDKLKKYIETIEGDIVGVGDDIVILAPKIVKIIR